MLDKGTDFPQYRKLSNDKVFYKIVNNREFHEIQVIGTFAQLHKIEAKQYPEILKIQDMLNYTIEAFVPSSAEEYAKLLNANTLN
ncbi:MAG: hypothetical protein P8N52_08400 [Crocinitomicaceae bacterium]|nr:hypothetical protein [Crocinitomicaceae bacterium]MDG1776962.1 hypothetical protein [Crocinitomicaceae bacterium]